MKLLFKSLFAVICILGLSSQAIADDHEAPPNMADMWVVHVKTGMAAEFEAAFNEHMAYRAEHGDPRTWNVFTVAVGSDLGSYSIRACCFNWADFDAYDAWNAESNAGQHWNENVDQFVESYEHYFSAIDFENSNWPEGDNNFSLFGVTNWRVKPGAGGAMNAAKAKMSSMAKEHGWPRHWSWSSGIGGSPGLSLVAPFDNYAGMKAPEQSFAEFLTEHMGSQEEALELLNTFSTSAKGSTYTIYRHRKDLSSAADDE
jgi:hypothetical protein